jgi:hypothetical protein
VCNGANQKEVIGVDPSIESPTIALSMIPDSIWDKRRQQCQSLVENSINLSGSNPFNASPGNALAR